MMDNRGVSSTLNYVLGLGVATVLVMGLLIAGGNLIEDQREQVTRNELSVLGQQVVSDLAAADRFTQEGGEVTLNRDLPKSVAGQTYRITVTHNTGQQYYLTLTSARTDTLVRIEFVSKTTISPSSVDGGPIKIVGDGAVVEVQNG
ncbi:MULTISPECIES: hypothetical protein [unclassified Haladaptatus]|uniref:DUF7266 family protein n=1 Tax=unclassified Haladaptatus TaxID=2622732 RepID=UPI0023E80952|nr:MULTISPECIES: hypothetical protein [unclassified Haladaptatus]